MKAMNCSHICLSIVDHLICVFVLFPLCIFYWRGTWHLQDYYIAHNDYLLSSWVSLIAGCIFGPLLAFIHPVTLRCLKKRSRWIYIIGIRIHLYFSGWSILAFWRGLWNITDYYLTEGWINSVVVYLVAEIICIISNTARTNAGMPLSLNIDIDEDLCRPDTRFSTSHMKDNSIQYSRFFIFDVFFSHYVVTGCNVLVWRSMWNILDAFFYPQDALVSSVASLVVGLGCVIILFILSPLLAMASSRLDNKHWFWKLSYDTTIIAIATWAVLLSWRGGWDIVREYVIPDLRIGGWVCHIVGVVGLTALQGFSNVATNAIDVDGSYSKGEGFFPTDYLRYYFQQGHSGKKYAALSNGHSEDSRCLYDADAELSSDTDPGKRRELEGFL